MSALTGHAVIIGFGRVGSLLGEELRRQGRPFLVIETRREFIDLLRNRGIEVIYGNAANPQILRAANLPAARWLFVAIPNGFEAGQITEQARAANPDIEIIARAHSDVEVEHLQKHGANIIVMGEREIAQSMLAQTSATPS